jgi:hypothetical protein
VVELAIRDLKAGVGLRHHPSGKINANAAWLVIATLAHNLLRWVAAIGLGDRQELVVAKTCAAPCSACPAGSPAPPDDGRRICPPTGPGRHGSSWRWRGCAV